MNEERYKWLANLRCNSLSLTRNDENACNYMTASAWIDENPRDFRETDAEEIRVMKETNTIWCLQIYPETPIGFCRWYGATADAVVDAAMRDL